MTDLVEFLLARIAEDEAAARACAEVYPPPWDVTDRGWVATVKADAPHFLEVVRHEDQSFGGWLGDHVEHVARWDPARALAECAAKRHIIEFHQQWPVLVEEPPQFEVSDSLAGMTMRMTQRLAWTAEQEYVKRFGVDPPTAPMLLAMAEVYAGHPDWRPEWASAA